MGGKQSVAIPRTICRIPEASSEEIALNEPALPPEASQPAPQPAPQDLPSPDPPSQDRGIEWIFWGPNRLRAGWGILLFVLLFALFIGLDGMLLRFVFHVSGDAAGGFSVRDGLLSEITQLLCVFLATAIMALIERRPVFFYGYQGKARGVRFFSGLAGGFIAISALVLVLWKAGLLTFDGLTLHGPAMWEYAAGWGLVFLGTGFFEESLLRGYVQFTMTRGVGFWWGALLFSFLFGFIHKGNPGETPVGLFAAGAVGLIFCLSLWYTGSLWWAVGFHAAWDWGESYFYGTSDSGLVARGHLLGEHPVGNILWSGGLTGPEGSLLVIFLLVIVALIMFLWWGRRTQSPFAGSGWMPLWVRQRQSLGTAQKVSGAPDSNPVQPAL
jgi:membrane protease YdiL (CAAX protease family)